jgi:hypothetical protein
MVLPFYVADYLLVDDFSSRRKRIWIRYFQIGVVPLPKVRKRLTVVLKQMFTFSDAFENINK